MLCIHAGGGAAEPRDPHDGADLHAEFVRADRFGNHHFAQKGLAVRPGQVSALLFGRSFFGFLGLITLFYASSHAAQGDVTILNKTSPIWVTILAVIFMKEKLPKIRSRRWLFPWWVLYRVPPQL